MPEVAVEWVPLTTRVSREIADELEELARRNERSVAAQLRLWIHDRLAVENGVERGDGGKRS